MYKWIGRIDEILRINRLIERLDPFGNPTLEVIYAPYEGLPRKLGVFSSSFNPITNAHLEMLLRAREEFSLEGVLLLLAKVNVDKELFGATLTDRTLMLCLVARMYDRLWVGVSSHGRFVDKARAIKRKYPNIAISFIVGYDTLERIFDPKYYEDLEREIGELFDKAELIVFTRGDKRVDDIIRFMEHPFRSRFADKVQALKMPERLSHLSSTLVRERIASGEGISGMVPKEVEWFIRETGLYSDSPTYELRKRMVEYLNSVYESPEEVKGDVNIAVKLMAVNSQVGRRLKEIIRSKVFPIRPRRRMIKREMLVGDFDLTCPPIDKELAVTESRRCLNCPTPYCRGGCPLRTPVNKVLSLVANEEILEAYLTLRSANPLFGITSFLCQDELYCRGSCFMGKLMGEGCEIRSKEVFKFLWNWGKEHRGEIPPPAKMDLLPHPPKVAIVGSGPAGMAAAWRLAEHGCSVTIFERESHPGGIPYWETPRFRFPAEEVIGEIVRCLESLGVEFKLRVKVGKDGDLTLDDLFAQGYNLIFLATGLTVAKRLKIPGEEECGVISSKDLFRMERRLGIEKMIRSFKGKRVIVTEGGNTAMDTARTLLRYGAKPVVVYWKEKPRSLKKEYEAAKAEGVEFMLSTRPVHMRREKDHINVSAIRTKDGDPVPESMFEIQADMVINAIGALPDFECKDINRNGDGFVKVNPKTLQTSRDRVFAGGDLVKEGNVTTAIRDGFEVAKIILTGNDF